MFVYSASAATQGPQTITLDGRLFTSLTSDTALIDSSVVIDVKIYNGAGTCILYEEKQTVDTSQTDGRFTILVGSPTTGAGSSKRVSGEPGNAMATIFQNNSAIAGSCGVYSPLSGETRLVRLTIAPSTTGTIEVLSPDTTIDSVPNAMVAETLQGLDRDHVLAIDATTTLNQANVANVFSPTNYPLLTALLAGNSTSYVNSSVNGATLPTVAGVPASLAQGQIWFNSSANAFQYYNGSAVQSLGISGSGISSLSVGSSLTAGGVAGGTLTSSGTVDLVNSGVTAGTYSKVSVNAKGLVTYGTGLAESDIPTLMTAGHVVGDAIVSGTIGGSTAFYSSGNVTSSGTVQGFYVSSTYDLTRKLSIYGTGGTHSVSFMAPTMTSDYAVIFPAVQGAAGTTLVNDGSGNLSWTSSSSGSVTSVGLALPSIFSVTTPIVTSTGTLTAALATQNANLIFAGPASGAAGVPTFRGLAVADLPSGYDASVMKTSLATGKIWIGNSAGVAAAVTPFGDLTLSMAGSGSVTGLQGFPVAPTAPTGAGQILRWNGTAWTPNFLAMSDLRSTITGAQSLATCTAAQTLVFNSVTDSLACSSIQIANSQITWAATGANLVFAGPATGGAAAPTFRAISATDLPANAYDSTYFKQGGNAFGAPAVLGTADAQSLSINTAGLTRLTILSSGNVGIGVATPTARLMLPAGTVAAGTSPLKMTTGSLTTAPEPGAIEFDGASLYYTDSGSVRHPLAASGSGISALTGDVTASGNGSVSSTVARVNGVTYPASPVVNTVPVVTASGVVTYEPIPNAALANNSTTLGTTVLTLGGTANSVSGLNSLGLGVNGVTTATLALANGATGGATTSILPSASTLSAWSLTLPSGPGANGYFLTTNGSGLTSWSAPLGAGTVSAGVANQLAIYSTSGSVVNGLTSVASSVLLTDSSGLPAWKLSANDNFSQYALLSGRAGGQTWFGGSGASEGVTINSTSNTTKGFVALQTSGGNVGIGTTAALNSALLTLTASGGSSIDLSLNRGQAQQSVPSSYAVSDEGRLKFYQAYPGDYQRYFDFVSNGGTGSANSNLRFFTNAGASAALERVRIDGNGNVGIGTTSAGAILDINGLGPSQSAVIVPRDTAANRPTVPVNGMIRYATDLARLETYSSGAWTGLATSSSVASSASQWTTSGPNIYYNSTGNVGVGTATPGAAVDVVGSVRATNSFNLSSAGEQFVPINGQILTLQPTGTNRTAYFGLAPSGSSPVSEIELGGDSSYGSSANYGAITQNGTSLAVSNNSSTGPISFLTNGRATTAMTITAGGNLGIGTTTPGAILDIYGTGTSQSAILLPRDTTTARPAGINGMIRYNTTTFALETFANGAWNSLATSASGGGSSQWTTSGTLIYYNSGNVAIGTSTAPNALTVVGDGSVSGKFAVNGGNPSGTNSIALGSGAVASGPNSVAINWATAPGQLSFAAGTNTNAGGTQSVAMGEYTSAGAQDSVALNYYASASGQRSMAVGDHTTAPAQSQLAVGSYNKNTGTENGTGWTATDPIFSVGNGVSGATSTALMVLKNGNVGIGTIAPGAALDVNGLTTASAIIVPRDTAANRPTAPVNGMIRYATDLARLETYSSGAWSGIATGASASGNYLPLAGGTMTGAIVHTNGSVSAPSIALADGMTGLYGTAGTLAFTTAGAPRMVMNSTGYVGIGTATPNTNISGLGTALDIYGNFTADTPVANSLSVYTYTNSNKAFNTSLSAANFLLNVGQVNYPPLASAIIATASNNNNVQVVNGGTFTASSTTGYPTYVSGLAATASNTNTNSIANLSGGRFATSGVAGSTITNGIGVYSTVASSGSVTNGYGLYVDAVAGVTKFGIYENSGGKNYFAGNVGIGTATPGAALDINGLTSSSAVIVPRDTTANRPTGVNGMIRYNTTLNAFENYANGAWASLASTGSGYVNGGNSFGAAATIGTNDNNTLGFKTNGTTQVTIDTSGNVGIGTTVPGGIFQIGGTGVKGNVRAVLNDSSSFFGIYDSSNSIYYGLGVTLPSPSGTSTIAGYYKGLGIGGASNASNTPIFGVLTSSQSGNGVGNVAFTIKDTNEIDTYYNVLDNGSGKMGIGTTSPANALSLWGTANFGLMELVGNGNSAESSLAFHTSNIGHSAVAGMWVLGSNVLGTAANSFGLYSGGTNTTVLSVTPAGYVGIGTPAASSILHVYGSGAPMRLESANSNQNKLGLADAGTVESYIGASSTKTFALQTPGGSEQVTVLTNGNVGIGNVAPAAALDVTGSSIFRNYILGILNSGGTFPAYDPTTQHTSFAITDNISNGSGEMDLINTSSLSTAGFAFYKMTGAGAATQVMSISSAGNVTIPGTLTQSSDERLKTNIQRIPNSLERISQLEGVNYQWLDKAKEQTPQIGLIAQATEKVFPEAVRTDEHGWKSVAYQNLIAPVINAIQELNHKLGLVDEREQESAARIKTLEKENADLKAYLCAKDPAAPFCAH